MSFLAKSLTERKIPRAMTSRWILENQNLDLVKPGRIGRCKMDPHVGMTIDKLPDLGRAMGREIVCDNVNLLASGKDRHDLFKESHKLRTGMARGGLAQHLAGFGVKRGIERKGAVTIILKTVSLGSSGREGQN